MIYEKFSCVDECPSDYYKLGNLCLDECDGNLINYHFTYLADKENRICDYCDPECKHGCSGPVRKLIL